MYSSWGLRKMTNMILWEMSLVRKMMRGPKNGMGQI